jgi:prepilin-type processing-associated H-X9-DG protein
VSWLRIPYLATLIIVLLSVLPAAAESPLLEGDPGDGIPLVTSPDGAFSVRALGYVQPRLVFFDGGADTDVSFLVAGDPNDRPGFKIRRGRFGLAGTLGQQVSYKVLVGASSHYDTWDKTARPDSGGIGVLDAWLQWNPHPLFELRGGAGKVPFGGQQTQSSAGLALVERATVAEHLAPGYDAGAHIHGSLAGPQNVFAPDGISWTVGVYSGDGSPFTPDDNMGVLAVGRLTVALGDDLGWSESCLWDGMFGIRIGGGAALNFERESRDNLFGGDIMVKIWRVALRGEYLYGKRVPAYSGAEVPPFPEQFKRHGYLMQVGFMIVPDHLEVAFRHDYYDDDLEDEDDYSAVRNFGGGANVFFLDGRVKVQLDYLHRFEPGAVAAIGNDTFLAQATLVL